MKKIVFGITGLTLGGAERVLVDLANKLSKTYDITIYTIYRKRRIRKRIMFQDKVKILVQKKLFRITQNKKKFDNAT